MSSRPVWMDPERPKAPRQPTGASKQTQSYITSQVPPVATQHVTRMQLPSVVTVGVAIIATLMLMSVYFWAGIWIIGRINPPSSEFGLVFASDYLSTARVIIAFIGAGIATAATWSAGNALVE